MINAFSLLTYSDHLMGANQIQLLSDLAPDFDH